MSLPEPVRAAEPAGAYGLRLEGVDGARDLLVPAAPSWPRIELRSEVGRADPGPERVGDAHARLLLRSGGEILIDRTDGVVRFRVPHAIGPEELVHPYLAPAAAIFGRWLGRESFHGGAFVAHGAAWGVLGEREAGKSSTLASLAAAGHDVVCDDMLVLEGLDALPGPRSIDLRSDAARALQTGEFLGVVGARERWRLRLAGDPGTPRLGGWVFLAWGEQVEAVALPPADRLARLVPHLGVRLPLADPSRLLELAALPAWELRRPSGWESLPGAIDALLAALAP